MEKRPSGEKSGGKMSAGKRPSSLAQTWEKEEKKEEDISHDQLPKFNDVIFQWM